MKTTNLIGPALDWAVATCEGVRLSGASLAFQVKTQGTVSTGNAPYSPSPDWALGGPIIEREEIELLIVAGSWCAQFSRARLKHDGSAKAYHRHYGPTPLVAAMRCYVASKLGDEIEIPKELTQ
jgi:hypothetical protein